MLDFHARSTPGRDRLLAELDRYGVSRAAVCAGGMVDPFRLAEQIVCGGHVEVDPDNDAVLELCAGSDGRLVPFYFANPHQGPDRYAAAAADFRGVELSPAVHGVGFDDPRTAALVEVAAAARHPVYVVCIGRAGSTVHELVGLAQRYPEVSFVLGHCGFIGIDFHAVATVGPEPNIFAELSGCYTAVARVALTRLGPDRVVFGSEYPVQDIGVELAKCRALGLTDDQWRRVTWSTGSRLLGEDAP
jgi:uncharacterized protein